MIRNFYDYKQDVESILKQYWIGYELPYYKKSISVLNSWLKLRNYSDDELDFITLLLEDELAIEIDKVSDPWLDEDFQMNVAIHSIMDVIEHLSGNKKYPSFIESSDAPYVRLKEKYKKAEIWAIDNGFIERETGKWSRPKGRLATFLFILEDEKIISGITKEISRNQIDEYFTSRYSLGERLDDSFKRSGKADKYKEEFKTLKVTLSINRKEN